MNWENIKMYASKIFSHSWVRWIHEGTSPAKTNEQKMLNTIVGILSTHCAECLNLTGCCFTKEKSPRAPLHENCHCKVIEWPMINPFAVCPIEKFTEYLFDKNKSGGKKDLFESWGYSIIDSENLTQEFMQQAKLAYMAGDYILGTLDQYGQRISIVITLPRRNGTGAVSFVSGWMVYPDGKIILTTPYGGKGYENA